MFGGQICVLMGSVVLLLFVPVLRCMISTKSNLFNNFVLLMLLCSGLKYSMFTFTGLWQFLSCVIHHL